MQVLAYKCNITYLQFHVYSLCLYCLNQRYSKQFWVNCRPHTEKRLWNGLRKDNQQILKGNGSFYSSDSSQLFHPQKQVLGGSNRKDAYINWNAAQYLYTVVTVHYTYVLLHIHYTVSRGPPPPLASSRNFNNMHIHHILCMLKKKKYNFAIIIGTPQPTVS